MFTIIVPAFKHQNQFSTDFDHEDCKIHFANLVQFIFLANEY